jgi:hypothetical protein
MGDVLRSNAERLLRDVQSIHARMVGELERVEPESDSTSASAPASAAAREPDAGESGGGEHAAGDGDVLDVPDFVARQ